MRKPPAFPLPWSHEISERNRKSLVTSNMAAISNGRRVFARTRRKIFRILVARNLANTTQSASQYCVNLVRYWYAILYYFIACTKSTLYKALVRPKMENASIVWDPHCIINEILTNQRIFREQLLGSVKMTIGIPPVYWQWLKIYSGIYWLLAAKKLGCAQRSWLHTTLYEHGYVQV